MILELIREHEPVNRETIDMLLFDKLPEVLSDSQKKTKVHNLLSGLSRKGLIRNTGSKTQPRWVATDGEFAK